MFRGEKRGGEREGRREDKGEDERGEEGEQCKTDMRLSKIVRCGRGKSQGERKESSVRVT